MAEGPRGPGNGPEPPDPPPVSSGRPPDEPPAWKAFVLGSHGSARRTSALRGLAAAIVVLVIGVPLAIALPGSGSPAAAPSPSPSAAHAGKHRCPENSVKGGEKPPAVQPAAVAPDDTVFAFGPAPRVHASKSAPPSHIEVWLNTDEPDAQGSPLGTGPVKQLASEKIGRDCAFSISFPAPRVPSGNYDVRVFSISDASKQGWEELGGRTLTIRRHPDTPSKTDATTFATDFLLARLIHAGGAVKAMLSKSADFPPTGEPGALFAQSYRKADVTSIHASSKGTYRVDVRIASADGPPVQQTLDVGMGTNPRGDELSLVVTASVHTSTAQQA